MKIYLIRHGESTGDIEDRYGGNYDDHLSNKGKIQALDLARSLKDKGIQKIFTSSFMRAKETAEVLCDSLELDFEIINGLRERNQYGVLTGLVKAEAKEKYRVLVEQLKNFHNTIEGAESYDTFKQRILKSFDNITKHDWPCVAIVTHGGPIKVILRMILNQENIDDIKDCGFCLIDVENSNYKVLSTDNLYK